MNISINEKVLQKHNLSVEEFLILYLCAKETRIEEVIQTLIDKGLCERDLYNGVSAVASNNTKDLVSSILVDSDKAVVDKNEEFLSLAEKMRQIFPAGRKAGTTYMWRDSTAMIASKLKTVVARFDFHFTEEQAIKATQRYVDSFGGDYQYMQLLKYFILKRTSSGEFRSDFMALIENEDDRDIEENDFVKMR